MRKGVKHPKITNLLPASDLMPDMQNVIKKGVIDRLHQVPVPPIRLSPLAASAWNRSLR
jgi:hypothetical protein